MPIVLLTIDDLNKHHFVPPALTNIITIDTWKAICSAMASASAQAHGYACCIEVAVCLVCAFPFIFCCHPCIYMGFAGSTQETEINRLNSFLFNGNRVLGKLDTNVTFNTDLYLALNQGTMNPTYTQPVYVQQAPPMAEAVYVDNKTTYIAPAAAPAPVAVQPPVQSQPPQPRQMSVQVPNGAEPGQVLRVQAPNGTIVQITIPENASIGQELIVHY